jgi:NAD dependent epimerase/dehydratase
VKNILITGSAGFIGSHLTEKLVKDGNKVKALVNYNSRNNWGWLENNPVLKDVEIISGNIRDFDLVNNATKNCDTVFHLAALIGIPYSYISPSAYIKTNIEGTYNVLESARKNNLSNVIITSTSETYGSAQYVPICENHPLVGQSPYSASKIAADQLAISYNKSFDLPVKIVRPFNTYGPRQSERAIIPTIISQILNNKKEITLGNTTPTRDFTFVKDTVKGFLEISKNHSLNGEVTNIGMKEEISVLDLVKLIANLMGTEIQIKADDNRIRPDNSEVQRLFCDNSKIIAKTKWLPDYNIRSGLNETINWARENEELFKPNIYNV